MHKILQQIQNQLLLLNLDANLFEVIVKWLRTELTYTSNNIEGNTLTREETALTVEDGITSGAKPIKDYMEAKNHAEAFDYVVSLVKQEKISYEDVVLKIHSLILSGMNDENKGRYRTVRVRIAGSNAVLPNPLKVPQLMEEFAERLDSKPDNASKALEAHYQLVKIHPFVDGNGRTARLLMNLILMRCGLLPLIVPPIERKRYISSISSRVVNYSIGSNSISACGATTLFGYHKYMLRLLGKSMNLYVKLFGANNKETDHPLLTIGKFAKHCGVPISTIRYYLRIKKLEPYSYTNAGYMLFSREQASVTLDSSTLAESACSTGITHTEAVATSKIVLAHNEEEGEAISACVADTEAISACVADT
ncbi:cell division protein Fic [Alphaproteobacteria bacterium]|nr:cell division protein Fic [Alphaproteobacteria bacterium]